MKRKEIAAPAAGMLIDAALAGPMTEATSKVTAELREITVFIDGRPAVMEAVNVADTNYVKLRNIGREAGFNVWWDGKVQIETGTPYTGEAPAKLDANMDIRKVMIRRINEVRVENGVQPLEVSDVLMDAAQEISTLKKREHGLHEWEAMEEHGWPYGGEVNLTVFTCNDFTNIGETAVRHWYYSQGHFRSMIREDGTCLGVGVTMDDDIAYCCMIVGVPDSHSPLN